ncbi:glutathione S-transferase [Acinetobacter sp. MD2(2019)]|uniref:glutathione S-transferase n=1 Tax=Acinetobacter sp. MD2(2019) TaxID=2605273 RepID=UPI002D1F45EA|nr:glutathione S-transferase [Acinetobacter sp. MD2(2019)]MEB3753859.1 glutathione S-transferase [Acinetobacter sp. MD2(2019)]
MRILYQFPLSHFCEKARWLLDYKELDYMAQNLTPGWHQAFARLKTGQNNLPILKDGSNWIADATQIAKYLDQNYPEHVLLGVNTAEQEKILALDHISQQLGGLIRQWLFSDLWQQDEAVEIALGEKGYLRKFSRFSKPAIKKILSKGFDLDDTAKQQLQQQIQQQILELNQQLPASAEFFVGQRLSLADIAVCSMLAPLLNIVGTPWELESSFVLDAQTAELQQFLIDLPLGEYVMQTYANARNARVDWRGV